jgi:hypothetical protein
MLYEKSWRESFVRKCVKCGGFQVQGFVINNFKIPPVQLRKMWVSEEDAIWQLEHWGLSHEEAVTLVKD